MSKKDVVVLDCLANECSFNHDGKCRTIGIIIGAPDPSCDTFVKSEVKGGPINTVAKVGACKALNCRYNDAMVCTAEDILIMCQDDRPLCAAYQLRV